ncbi:nuclear transport factor 2 family protein [Asanoa iriomotensis]|uniref:SnoaL-like domain-containing protein n=1 Tax=Asanoa iriomotensis TaxID=234613 RepID=A0ABQ4CAQ1_9ACTN|nr:nuclear transport factor 2 family protein [Asanoa iriomotensis]GIF59856.1 hypothetical protein Air01nite_59510 [Asanoa iriomotensis]
MRPALIAATLTLFLATGCDTGPAPGPDEATQPAASQPVDQARAETVAQRFAEAANAGDRTAVTALFAPDARFDSVGRIYPDRTAIIDTFLGPEVLDAGGRYAPGEQRWEGDRLVVSYTFTTRSGGQERFTYAYLIQDGLIRDVVGRYVR